MHMTSNQGLVRIMGSDMLTIPSTKSQILHFPNTILPSLHLNKNKTKQSLTSAGNVSGSTDSTKLGLETCQTRSLDHRDRWASDLKSLT